MFLGAKRIISSSVLRLPSIGRLPKIPPVLLDDLPEVKRLSPAQKFDLINELWHDLAEDMPGLAVSDEIAAELERRMDAYRRDPSTARSWEEVKAGLRRAPHNG